jgi:hypothetical protein
MEVAATRSKRKAATARLPDELLEEIFVRLPAKSIGRFRCVSRSWDATLSSASFVDLHLRRANPAGQPKVFLVPDASSADADALYAWQAPAGSEIKKLTSLDADKIPQSEMLLPLTKPCRGLVLLRCPPSPVLLRLQPIHRSTPARAGHKDGREGRGPRVLRARLLVDRDGAPVATRCEVLVLDASSTLEAERGEAPLRASSPGRRRPCS